MTVAEVTAGLAVEEEPEAGELTLSRDWHDSFNLKGDFFDIDIFLLCFIT